MNTVNDVKIIICEKMWKSKYYILCLKEDESIMKKRCLSWLRLRLIKKQGSSAFISGKISRSFIYSSLNNSEQKFQKNICFKIIVLEVLAFCISAGSNFM